MASIQVLSYLNQNTEIAKQWLQDKSITSKSDLDRYLKNKQVEARKPIVSERRESLKEMKNQKTESNIQAIMSLAKQQDEEMQERIKEYDLKN